MVHKPKDITKDDWNFIVGSAKIRGKNTGEFILDCVKKVIGSDEV